MKGNTDGRNHKASAVLLAANSSRLPDERKAYREKTVRFNNINLFLGEESITVPDVLQA